MSVEGAKSIKPSFLDLTPSTVAYQKKHKNIKQKGPKYALVFMFLGLKKK